MFDGTSDSGADNARIGAMLDQQRSQSASSVTSGPGGRQHEADVKKLNDVIKRMRKLLDTERKSLR